MQSTDTPKGPTTRRQFLYAGDTGPIRVGGKERRLKVFLVCRSRRVPATWEIQGVGQQLAQLFGEEMLLRLRSRRDDANSLNSPRLTR